MRGSRGGAGREPRDPKNVEGRQARARCGLARCDRNWAICIWRSGAKASRDSRAITEAERSEIIGLPPDFYRNAAIYTIGAIRAAVPRAARGATPDSPARARSASCAARTLHSRAGSHRATLVAGLLPRALPMLDGRSKPKGKGIGRFRASGEDNGIRASVARESASR